MTYEDGERYDPARPVSPTSRFAVCPVDGCVVDRRYTEISQREIVAYDSLHQDDASYEYCCLQTVDGSTVICDAAILRESPVLAVLIDAAGATHDHSPIVFSEDLLQPAALPIIIEKLVYQHTWRRSCYGDIPRDPATYSRLYENNEVLESAVFVALDTLEL